MKDDRYFHMALNSRVIYGVHLLLWVVDLLGWIPFLELVYGTRCSVLREAVGIWNFLKILIGPFKQLTVWNMLLQMIYLTYCLVFPFLPNRSNFRKIRDSLFATSFTYSLVVCIVFWIAFFVDPGLFIPSWTTHSTLRWVPIHTHVTVLVVMIIDMLLVHHDLKKTRDMSCIIGFGVGYMIWTLLLKYRPEGSWPYPFMHSFSPPIFLLVSFLVLCILYGFYCACCAANGMVWKSSLTSKKSQ